MAAVINGGAFDWGVKTFIMGIVNMTPDSFSDGGSHPDIEAALSHARIMAAEGADIIDVGGESTRPGAQPVDQAEEAARVLPVIRRIRAELGVPVSVDTYRAKTAEAAISAGAGLVNDVWGLTADPDMARVVAQNGAAVCIMHNSHTKDYVNLIEDIKRFFANSIELALKSGVREDGIIIDPGIGFGKTYEHNLQVMRNLDVFKSMGYPVLLGASRKSMVGLTLGLPVDQRLEGTIAANVIGIMKNVDIIRVHDVEANRRAAVMADRIVRGNG